MIKLLSIRNYALIEELEIEFYNGLNIITGETGAGKSILVGALSLILGQRADTSSLRKKDAKCVVEGIFEVSRDDVKSFFNANGLDYIAQTIIRREINPAGNSRAFINDTPVNLQQLKELGLLLVDIHSQHETLLLNSCGFQLSILDSYSRQQEQLAAYLADYNIYKKNNRILSGLLEDEARSMRDIDYYRFLLDELDAANLVLGEHKELEQELGMQNNSENIKNSLFTALSALHQSESNALAQLMQIKHVVATAAKNLPRLNELDERINSVYIELQDIAGEMEAIQEKIVFDPVRIQQLNERLNQINRLQQKHRVQTTEQLIEIREDYRKKTNSIVSLSEQINSLKQTLEKQKEKLICSARVISDKRKAVVPKIVKDICALLKQLGMPNSKFIIENTILSELSENGTDDIQFLFSANKGGTCLPLNKVASGGELSRLMLSLKSLVARRTALPTIIFDEVDSGVSGEIAEKMGNIMETIADNMQVIAITHLPQIASKGSAHFQVYKRDEQETTKTYIKYLDEKDRVREIAKMLSGENLSEAALRNAKVLLRSTLISTR